MPAFKNQALTFGNIAKDIMFEKCLLDSTAHFLTLWIPAFAGMTEGARLIAGARMTEGAGKTVGARMTEGARKTVGAQ